jgi:cyanophycinase
MPDSRSVAGALALVGSGEYLAVMDEIDRRLLTTIGGPAAARVALLPTASGLEGEAPSRWNELGRAHFRALGAPVEGLPLLRRQDASDPAILASLREASFFYISGGNPSYVIECLLDTPAWQIIVERHQAGAVLAGCSAGAMMLGSHVLDLRRAMAAESAAWRPALGLVAGLAVIPHFDRFAGRFGPSGLQQLPAAAPVDLTVVGIDEDTALLRLPSAEGVVWEVQGRAGVSVFAADRPSARYRGGERVHL